MRPLTGVVKNYAWGSPDAIPAILCTESDGMPQAEYWLGAHPSSPAAIEDTTLDRLVAARPEVLGAARERFDGQFPYLLKILAAARPLSLQAHPSLEQALAGFAAEEALGIPIDDPTRTYKDTWPKPELLVALGPFEALWGFRDPLRTAELFDALKPRESLEPLIGPLRHRGAEAGLAEVFLECLCPDEAHRAMINGVLSAALHHADAGGEMGDFARLAIRLDEFYPSDPSILAALLLNHVHLEAGQGLHVPAGVLHAYLSGTGIEIMASSDNVVRGGLTPKHIDVDALVSLLRFLPAEPDVVTPVPIGAGISYYPTDEPEFALWRAELELGRPAELPGAGRARILLVIEGHVQIQDGQGGDLGEIHQGQSVFFEADEQIRLHGDCLAFVAASGEID
ncbi:mannose-6-phosphate isomerase, class I [Propionibacterium australiense]|uniref:mannose-6-phosphate isomerase n=1 Tax=Propionibacterium australiense TaxID=119981 RepID=A0A383S9K0_9ACTN|nr:mannose-6-phosphate isomerase, class I [Propionibacterium australiense]RLP06202.1 mannose-6-phosphate isomerase, class I [Propionibacterium australiense]RLP06365.1 mannose-6-phosphate isomerase, class I [Propionibacterium australiense]SYZ34597.1 Mannose-6-phosphate isomerase [Propionibacterium australiense]VEH92134.1 Mannose-6-phosphate isomerase [Propionibacterium australiense]